MARLFERGRNRGLIPWVGTLSREQILADAEET